MEKNINLTDEILIDMEYLPLDIVVKFIEIYNENIDEDKLKNMILASIQLTKVMDKSDILDDVIKWATDDDVEEVKKKVKTKYRMNIYLNLFARIEDYLSITNNAETE